MWKDKLVSYDGKTITYDEAGHPLEYMGSTMTWDASDRLTSISKPTENAAGESNTAETDANKTITYTYLSDGSRRTKTVDGVTTTYHYNNGLLLSQSTGDETLHFYYDSTGKIVSVGYQKGEGAETGYFFTRNAQGDILGVYRSSDSKCIGTYEYDLWGRPISTVEATEGIDMDGILTKNPFRYRGYYYDSESGFYYLNARYYDAEVRRFISADSVIAGVGTTVEGYNLFGYCFNNPVNMCDETGYWPEWVENTTKVASVVVAVAAAVVMVAAVSAVTAGTGSVAAVAGASIFLGAALSGINGGVANEAKGNSYVNGYVGGATGGAIQGVCSKTPQGTIIGGAVGVAAGTAITDGLNNLDPDSSNSTAQEIATNAITSGGKALVTSSVTAYMGYSTNYAVTNGTGGLMPTYSYAFGEGTKIFYGWADDAAVYAWE